MKRIGRDRQTANRVARVMREKLLRGDLHLQPADDTQTLEQYAAGWLKTMRGALKASTAALHHKSGRKGQSRGN